MPRGIKKKMAKGTHPKRWWQTRDIAGLEKKKQSVTPEAQALAIIVTEKFCIPDKIVSELPTLEDSNVFEVDLKTFRVKIEAQLVSERLDECRSVGLDGITLRVLKLCMCCCIFLANKSKFTEDSAEWSFARGLEVCTCNSYS